MSHLVKLLSEAVGSTGIYSGTFEAYGLKFTVTYKASGTYFIPTASPDNPKRPSWQVDASVRLCQMAAVARAKALGIYKE